MQNSNTVEPEYQLNDLRRREEEEIYCIFIVCNIKRKIELKCKTGQIKDKLRLRIFICNVTLLKMRSIF